MKFNEIEIDNLMNIIASFEKIEYRYNNCDSIIIKILCNDIKILVDYRSKVARYIYVCKNDKILKIFTKKMIKMDDLKDFIEAIW